MCDRRRTPTLLTRDRELAGRAENALLLTGTESTEQPVELDDDSARCGRCNGRLDAVDPESTTPAYAPDPAAVECFRCRSCGQIFWKGSHRDRVEQTLTSV